MYNKKMFLDDSISIKDKNTEKKEGKTPLLQIFFNNNNIKDKNIDKKPLITKTQQSSKFSSSFNFNFQKKASDKNIKNKNVPVIKKLKNIKYLFNNEQIKNNDNCSFSKDSKNKENQIKAKFNNSHLFESRNTKNKSYNNRNTISVSLNDNSLFPILNDKTNLFRIKKNDNNKNNKNNLDEKNRPNDLIYNNINLKNNNNNSIIITESRPNKFSFFQKYLGDKINSKKSVNFNNYNSYKNLISEESYLKKRSSFRINTEKTPNKNDNIYINEINKSNNSNTINLNLDELELNKKINKIKSIKFNTLQNDENTKNKIIITENYPEIKKKINIPRNNMKNLKLSIQTFTPEKSRYSQNENNDTKQKKIFSMKRNENVKILNKIIKPIKTSNDNLKTIFNTNENDKENDEITNPSNKIYNSINYKDNYNLINDRNNYDSFDSKNNNSNNNTNFIIRKKTYSAQDKIIINKFKKIDENKYITSKRLKMIEKITTKKIPDFDKKKYIKNSIIDIIYQNILNKEVEDKLNEEKKKLKLKKMNKYLKEILYYILSKPNEFYYFENIDKLGLYFYIDEIIDPKIKIQYNLEMFDIYQDLNKDFTKIWNNNYIDNIKKIKEHFSIEKIINCKSENNIYSDFYEIIDRKFFIYKERIKNDYNLYLDSIHFNIKNETKKKAKNNNNKNKVIKFKINNEIIPKHSMKQLRGLAFKRSKTLNLTLNNNKTSKNLITINEYSLNDDHKSLSNSKPKKKIEMGLAKQAKSTKKFVEIQEEEEIPKESKKKINISNIINNKKEIINEKEMEKVMAFNDISAKLENFNPLKNANIFNLKKKIKNKDYKMKNNKIQLNLGSDEKKDNKNQKNEKDIYDVKLFNELISILKNKDIDKYFNLINNNKDSFNNIINRKELKSGNTLLIYATENNLKSIVESLLLKGADPNIQNIFGNSALHIAYKNNNTFLVNLLIEYKANENLKNIKNIIPKQMDLNYKLK